VSSSRIYPQAPAITLAERNRQITIIRLVQGRASHRVVMQPRIFAFRMVSAGTPEAHICTERHAQVCRKIDNDIALAKSSKMRAGIQTTVLVFAKAVGLGVRISITKLSYLSGNVDEYEELVACGGTKYCCIEEGLDCCTAQSKIFDVGVPYVVNYYGSVPSSVPTGLDGLSTTAQPTIATATGTSTKSTSTSGSTSGSTSTSSASPSTSGGRNGVMIGVAAGIVGTLILVGIAVGIFFCLRRHGKPEAPMNMMNMQPPSTSYGESQGNDYFSHSKPGSSWESNPQPPAPPPWSPTDPNKGSLYSYYISPVGSDGKTIAEVDSTPAPPKTSHGAVVHELA
jgi:hypothetical protein